MRLTITNATLRTSARLNVPEDGIVSAAAAAECRRRLKVPPGFADAGPLGEFGEQSPAEAPGFAYDVEQLEDGRVRLSPREVRRRRAAGR